MNRRIPNGTYGGVRGRRLAASSYSIRHQGAPWTPFQYKFIVSPFWLTNSVVLAGVSDIAIVRLS
jgi:hypothetical protein